MRDYTTSSIAILTLLVAAVFTTITTPAATSTLVVDASSSAEKQQQIKSTMERVERALADLAMDAQHSFTGSWQDTNGACKFGCSHLACGRRSSIVSLQCFAPQQDDYYGSQENLCPSSNVTAAPTFASGTRRSMDNSAVLLPPGFNYQSTSTAAFVCATKNLTSVFQAKAESEELKGFTYIADVNSGAIRSYPAVPQDLESDLCKDYDAREQPWLVASATGGKDVVIIVENTEVMNEVTAWKQKSRLQVAKDSIMEVLSGLNSRDRVAVIGTNSNVALVASGGSGSYGATTGKNLLDGHLLRGTTGNVSSITNAVNNSMVASGYSLDLEGSLTLAFNMLNNSYAKEGARPDSNRPIILFLSSGILSNLTTSMTGVNNAIKQGQGALSSGRAYIRTYTIASNGGSYATESHLLRQIGCENEGIWEQIPDIYGRDIDPAGVVAQYYDFLTAAESAAVTTNTSNVAWTSPYTSPCGAGSIVTASKPVLVGGKVVGIVATDVSIEEFGVGVTTPADSDLLEEVLLRATLNPLEQKPPTWCETQYSRDKKSGYLCEAPDAPVGSNTTCPTITQPPQVDVNTTFCHNRTVLDNETSSENLSPACCYDALPPTPSPPTPAPPSPAPPTPEPPTPSPPTPVPPSPVPPTPSPPTPAPPSPAPPTPVPPSPVPPTPVPPSPVPPTPIPITPVPPTPIPETPVPTTTTAPPGGGASDSDSESEFSSGESTPAPPSSNVPTPAPPSSGLTPIPGSVTTPVPTPTTTTSGSGGDESSSGPLTTRVIRLTTTVAPGGPGTPPAGGPGTPVPFGPGGGGRGSKTKTLTRTKTSTVELESSSSSNDEPSGGAPPTPVPGGGGITPSPGGGGTPPTPGGGGGGGGGSKTPTLTLTLSLTKTLTLSKSLSLTPNLVFNGAAPDSDGDGDFWWWWILLIIAGVILLIIGAALARRRLTHRSKGSNKFLDNTKYTKFFDVDVDQAMLEANERPVAEMEAEMNLKYVMKDEGGAGPDPSDMDLQAVIAGAKAGKIKVTDSSTSRNINIIDETADIADANRRNDNVLDKSTRSFLGVSSSAAGLGDTLQAPRSPNRSPLADTLQLPLAMTVSRLGGTLKAPQPVLNLADTLNLGAEGMSQMRFEDADELSVSDDEGAPSAAPPLSQVLGDGNHLRLPPQRLDATVESLNLEMTQTGDIPIISTQRPSLPPGGGMTRAGNQANGGYQHHMMDALPESGGSRMIFLDI